MEFEHNIREDGTVASNGNEDITIFTEMLSIEGSVPDIDAIIELWETLSNDDQSVATPDLIDEIEDHFYPMHDDLPNLIRMTQCKWECSTLHLLVIDNYGED